MCSFKREICPFSANSNKIDETDVIDVYVKAMLCLDGYFFLKRLFINDYLWFMAFLPLLYPLPI